MSMITVIGVASSNAPGSYATLLPRPRYRLAPRGFMVRRPRFPHHPRPEEQGGDSLLCVEGNEPTGDPPGAADIALAFADPATPCSAPAAITDRRRGRTEVRSLRATAALNGYLAAFPGVAKVAELTRTVTGRPSAPTTRGCSPGSAATGPSSPAHPEGTRCAMSPSARTAPARRAGRAPTPPERGHTSPRRHPEHSASTSHDYFQALRYPDDRIDNLVICATIHVDISEKAP